MPSEIREVIAVVFIGSIIVFGMWASRIVTELRRIAVALEKQNDNYMRINKMDRFK